MNLIKMKDSVHTAMVIAVGVVAFIALVICQKVATRWRRINGEV